MICIGPLQVDLACRALSLDGEPVRLGSRAFDILAVLVAADGALVSKNDLFQQVWPETIVEENNLQVHMSALRKALGAHRGLIQTVSGRGYRIARAQSEVHPEVAAATRRAPTHNLPSNSSALIGRDTAITDIATALDVSPHVTLVGAGGIGKTRLAIETARSLLAHFADGVFLVPLASTSDAPGVLAAFASVLGVNPASGPLTPARIGKEIGERRMLVVLDNCEHVLRPAAELAEALVNVSSTVRVLATSREPLKVLNERVYWVASLDVPQEGASSDAIFDCGAVRLFLARARSFDARLSCDERSMQLTATVCKRLDGIPLAIELAAARAAVLGIDTLAAHLDDRFSMLTGGNRTALPRHQTLKATLDWSHALLGEPERVALRRLGIFAGAFTMDAAIAVVRDEALGECDAIDAVSGLVEKSLVVTQMSGGAMRYRLLETTRSYASQKLDDNGERRAITLAHARYFSAMLERVDDEARHDEQWQRRMREPLDDVRAAMTWALSPKGDASLCASLAVRFVSLLFELSLVDECCMWARRCIAALEKHGHDDVASHIMHLEAALAAALVYVHGPDKETRMLWSDVLARAVVLEDHAFEARALWGMWNACQSAGEVNGALSFARRFAALAVDGEAQSFTHAMLGHRIIGIASSYAGRLDEARASLERFLPHADALRLRLPLGRSVDQRIVGEATVARVLWLQGERERALELARTCADDALLQDQSIVTCYVLIEALVPLALLSSANDMAASAIAQLHEVSARAGLNVAQACARAFDACLHGSVDHFRSALDELDALDFQAPCAMLNAHYALALERAGHHLEALDEVQRAIERSMSTGDLWYEAALLRIEGELYMRQGSTTDAELSLRAALDTARRQGCHTLQLRAATTIARLWLAQGRHADAADVLATACRSIEEGREWEDYRAAQALLREAQAQPACDRSD
jgi:predicted ATPase/DNA-binding winged helix-turn-helix (wHTH) protein